MPSNERDTDPGYALARALIDALLEPSTPEEIAESEAELAALKAEAQPPRRGVHLSVRPVVEVDPRVGRSPVRPPESSPTGGETLARPVPQEAPPDGDDSEDRCENCDDVGTVDGTLCGPCLEEWTNERYLSCPFCQQSSSDECEHLVFGQDSSWGWVFIPADGDELPRLVDVDPASDAWGDGEIEGVFGRLDSLAMAYGTPGTEPHPADFYERLAALLETPVVVKTGVGVLAAYSEHDRDAARAEVEAILGKLTEGFERLATSRGTALREPYSL